MNAREVYELQMGLARDPKRFKVFKDAQIMSLGWMQTVLVAAMKDVNLRGLRLGFKKDTPHERVAISYMQFYGFHVHEVYEDDEDLSKASLWVQWG